MSDHPTHDGDVRLVREAFSAFGRRAVYTAALDRILTLLDALMEEHEAWEARRKNEWNPDEDFADFEERDEELRIAAWVAHDKVGGLLHVAPAAPVSHDGMTTPDGEEQT